MDIINKPSLIYGSLFTAPILVTLRQKLEKAEQERDDLKLKLEKFETSSNNLAKLIGSQLDANNKTSLGYGNHVNGCEANDSKSVSHEEDSPMNDRFMKSNGNHAVPPPYTGNYMPPRADLSFAGLDDSVYKCTVTKSFLVKERPRKGQNQIKTGQKRDAWRSQEKSKAVTVDRGRKTKQNKKRMGENASTVKKLFKFKVKKKREGPDLQFSKKTREGPILS
nr:hypothetical protein [Tanacetum cinerariifolium]